VTPPQRSCGDDLWAFLEAEAGYEPIIDAVGPQQVQADGDVVNSGGGVGSAAGGWAAAAAAGVGNTAGVWAAAAGVISPSWQPRVQSTSKFTSAESSIKEQPL
jgi:hypothetical protein